MTIAAALSGGVDSSVMAALLKSQGHTVIGVHLSLWKENVESPEGPVQKNKCCSVDELETARRIAYGIGIPFYVIQAKEVFKKKVVDHFTEGLKNGTTPNPCVTCNRTIKFGFLLEKARQLGADALASGHYARIRRSATCYTLLRGKAPAKDQSYFLYHLTQKQLQHMLFPHRASFWKRRNTHPCQKAKAFTGKRKKRQPRCMLFPRTPRKRIY